MKRVGDKAGQFRAGKAGKADDAAQLFDGCIDFFPGVRFAGAEEKQHGGGRNGRKIGNQTVVSLASSHDGRMIPDNHQAAIRQEGKRFGRGDQLIRFRIIQHHFVHFLHAFGQKRPAQPHKRVLFHLLLFSLKEQDGRQGTGGKRLFKVFTIHVQSLLKQWVRARV